MRLNNLRATDLKRLSDFVGGMNHCADKVELENFVHSNLRSLADGDVTVWNELSNDGALCAGSTWPLFDEGFWNEKVPIISQFMSQHPYVIELSAQKKSYFASRLNDCPTYRPFLDSTLFNEVYEGWECRHQCVTGIDTGRLGHLVINVNRSHKNFSDRELELFKALGPHLLSSYHSLQRVETLKHSILASTHGVTGESLFWLSLGPHLHIQNASSSAQKILNESFERDHLDFQLPVELRDRLQGLVFNWRSNRTAQTSQRSEFDIQNAHRFFSFEFRSTQDSNFELFGFNRAPSALTPDNAFSNPGVETLTKREIEVLHWLCEGKTNPEIAILLSIQSKTVEHHLSAVFGKLGVKSRSQLLSKRIG